ncbi:MAG: Rieske 2Fe-2S domain-containing protein [Acidobacteriota bacterium]
MPPHDNLANEQGRALSPERIAIYRDGEGQVHAISSIARIEAALSAGNDREKRWDCPCHGSRFLPTGEVIHGPATKPLRTMALPAKLVLTSDVVNVSSTTLGG